MNFAHDCKEFRQALSLFSGPSQNMVYADTRGDIGYQLPGTIPIRARGDGSVPSPGWTGDYEWQGYIPFEELPHLENPPQGFIATANNPVSRPDFPHFLGRDYCASDRAARITELLQANDRVDIPYMKAMHMDQVSLSARALAHCLGQLDVTDPELKGIASEMWAWDGKLDPGSPLAAIYEVTFRQAVRLLLDHHLGPLGVRAQGQGPAKGLWDQHTWEWFIDLLYSPDSPWFDLGHGEQRDDVLRIALQRAVDFLKQELGPDRQAWAWGKLHQLTFGHVIGSQKPLDAVFNLGPFPIGGDGGTIWASFTNLHNLSHNEVVGPPFRFIADLGDLDHCWGVLAPGQSAHLASPHLADGVQPWFEGGYHPMLFNRTEVEQNLEARLVLE